MKEAACSLREGDPFPVDLGQTIGLVFPLEVELWWTGKGRALQTTKERNGVAVSAGSCNACQQGPMEGQTLQGDGDSCYQELVEISVSRLGSVGRYPKP